MNLCKYKNIFGEPNLGLHKHFFGFAIFDFFFTMIFVFIMTFFIKKHITKYSFSLIFSILLLMFVSLGEYMHIVFCVK